MNTHHIRAHQGTPEPLHALTFENIELDLGLDCTEAEACGLTVPRSIPGLAEEYVKN